MAMVKSLSSPGLHVHVCVQLVLVHNYAHCQMYMYQQTITTWVPGGRGGGGEGGRGGGGREGGRGRELSL